MYGQLAKLWQCRYEAMPGEWALVKSAMMVEYLMQILVAGPTLRAGTAAAGQIVKVVDTATGQPFDFSLGDSFT